MSIIFRYIARLETNSNYKTFPDNAPTDDDASYQQRPAIVIIRRPIGGQPGKVVVGIHGI